jgi:hypothetical protein
MVWDHMSVIWFPEYRLMRVPGLLVLPGFAWLGVTSTQKTRDIGGYLFGLIVLALLSQPFYQYALHYGARLNDIFGLVIGVAAGASAMKIKKAWPFVLAGVGSLASGITAGFISTMAAYAAYALYDSFPTMERDRISGRWFYLFYPGHLLTLGFVRGLVLPGA